MLGQLPLPETPSRMLLHDPLPSHCCLLRPVLLSRPLQFGPQDRFLQVFQAILVAERSHRKIAVVSYHGNHDLAASRLGARGGGVWVLT